MPLHLGNWEYLGYYLNTVAPLAPLYERPKSAIVDAALRNARERLGHDSAPDSVSGLRQLVKVLREGGMVAILPDQVPIVGSGVAAPFFGRDAFTMTLVAKLLQRVDADVVFGNATRVEGGFAIRIESIDDAIRDPDPDRECAHDERGHRDAGPPPPRAIPVGIQALPVPAPAEHLPLSFHARGKPLALPG